MDDVIRVMPDGLRNAKPPWTDGLVVVCRTCDGDAKILRRGLKAALRAVGARKRVRVVASGCLDICPKRATVVVTTGAGPACCTIVGEKHAGAEDLGPIVARYATPKENTL